MSKRSFFALVTCVAISMTLASQTTPVAPSSLLSGTVTVGFGDLNILGSPFFSDIPGFSASYATSLLSLRFTDGASQSYLDMTQYQDTFSAGTRIGYEAGITLDTANMLSFINPVSKVDTGDSKYNWYSYIQPMIDWWENNVVRFGLPADPYGGAGWPTTSYGATGGRYRFIHGSTVEPIQWVAWDEAKWSDAHALFTDLKARILQEIELISPDVTSSAGISQYDFELLSPAQQRLVLVELRAYYEFQVVTGGYETKAALLGPNLTAAYLRFTNLLGIMDARVDFLGARLSSGALLVSPRADAPAVGPVATFSLAAGAIPGLDAFVAMSLSGGLPQTVENWETRIMEYWPGEAAWFGLKLKAGYKFDDSLDADLALYWPDLLARPLTLGANAQVTWTMRGELSARVYGEAAFLTWQNRYDETVPMEIGYAFGLDASATWFGATLHALGLYKNSGFWGRGGSEASDRFPGTDLRSDFAAAKLADSVAVDAGLSYDFWQLTGIRLATLDFGYRIMLYDYTNPIGQGWYLSALVTLEDLFQLPLSFSLMATNYKNWSQYLYDDFDTGPVPGLLTGVTWSVAITLAPSKDLTLALKAAGRDSGWRMDTAQVVSIGFEACVKF